MNVVDRYNEYLALPIRERLKIIKPFTDNEMVEIYKLEMIRQIEENVQSKNQKNVEYLLKDIKRNLISPKELTAKRYDNVELLKEGCSELIVKYDSLYQKLNLL